MYSYWMAQVKAKLNGEAKQKHLAHSLQQDLAVSILRTANYLDRFCSPVFDEHHITSQQFNVLRICEAQVWRGFRHWTSQRG